MAAFQRKRRWFRPTQGHLLAVLLAAEATPDPKRRWFHPTPGHFLVVLLAVEGILLLSERWLPKGWAVLIAIAAMGVFLIAMLLWLIVALIFHRRFQFSLRSLLLLTVAVAIPFSWLAVEMKKAREQKATIDEIEVFGSSVQYDYRFDSEWALQDKAMPSTPAWLRCLLENDFFMNATFVNLSGTQVTDIDLERLKGLAQLGFLQLNDTKITDEGLEHLKGLNQLQVLILDDTPITDDGLERLKGLAQLHDLSLMRTQVTDAGLKHLKGLNQLISLSLYSTHVTDAGLEHLKGLTNLQSLDLGSTKITDAGLERLNDLAQLQFLDLAETEITDDGVEKLQQALAKCSINH